MQHTTPPQQTNPQEDEAKKQAAREKEARDREKEARDRAQREVIASEYKRLHFAHSEWKRLDGTGGPEDQNEKDLDNSLSVGSSVLSKMKPGLYQLLSTDPKHGDKIIRIKIDEQGTASLSPPILRSNYPFSEANYRKDLKAAYRALVSAMALQGFDTITMDYPKKASGQHLEREIEMEVMIEVCREQGLAVKIGSGAKDWLHEVVPHLNHNEQWNTKSSVEEGKKKIGWFLDQEKESQLNIQGTRKAAFEMHSRLVNNLPKVETSVDDHMKKVLTDGGLKKPEEHTLDYVSGQLEKEAKEIDTHTKVVEEALRSVSSALDGHDHSLQNKELNMDRFEKQATDSSKSARKVLESVQSQETSLATRAMAMRKQIVQLEKDIKMPITTDDEKAKHNNIMALKEKEGALSKRVEELRKVVMETTKKLDELPAKINEAKQQQQDKKGVKPK